MLLVGAHRRGLPLEGGTEQRQMTVALDPPQARFEVQQRRREVAHHVLPFVPLTALDEGVAACAAVPFTCEGRDRRLKSLCERLEAQWDEGLDDGCCAVNALRRRHDNQPAGPDVFHLALSLDSD